MRPEAPEDPKNCGERTAPGSSQARRSGSSGDGRALARPAGVRPRRTRRRGVDEVTGARARQFRDRREAGLGHLAEPIPCRRRGSAVSAAPRPCPRVAPRICSFVNLDRLMIRPSRWDGLQRQLRRSASERGTAAVMASRPRPRAAGRTRECTRLGPSTRERKPPAHGGPSLHGAGAQDNLYFFNFR